MILPAIVRKVAALCLLLASNATSATVLTLPTSNADERQLFTAPNAPDLQSACGSDPGCQPQAGLPVASPSGQITGQGIVPPPANGMNYFTSSFSVGGIDIFRSRNGDQIATYPDEPIFVNDAADEITSDEDLKWKVKLRLLQAYTNMRAMVSLNDLNQDGTRDAGNLMPGQFHGANTAGASAGYAAGIVPDLKSLCVGSNGSYTTIGTATKSACPSGSIYVDTRRSSVTMAEAEYAAYAQSVSNSARGVVAASSLHSVDWRYTRNDPAPRQYKRCDDCDVDQASGSEPGMLQQMVRWMKHPVSIALLVLGLIATIIADAVAKSRRA